MPVYWTAYWPVTSTTSTANWPWHYQAVGGGGTTTTTTASINIFVGTGGQVMFLPTGSDIYYHSIPPVLVTAMPHVPLRPRERPLGRPALLRGRRALRRSIDLLRMLRPADEVRSFLGGQPIIIHGHRFDYQVQKRDNLLSHTLNPDSPHIPYDLHLIDKTTGRKLAKGCVIVPGTPVIDQLLALMLHAQDATEEIVVLNQTNWTPRLAPAFLAQQREAA